ncbi:hypothetical protein Ait01nite_005910 [Actinoplanes italicus]|uniref:Uncharacterized protein n=1 Tax=Actinoplanes italicus TaxID=113567 RepID=A0A2T0KM72_9ACTN|nr:hypothetical protein [Actinoplanes italicus]PRX24726.1 hypothetical protein CLV67_102505 [Actinoplanes italicus]GIE27546.1 hypothetical protein Ait01nite_005910 [Actinoplanes italicus]
MTILETRYRRLLRAYPAGHRAAYGEEMIGVLMSGAEEGRRFPSPADAFDLVRAGLAVRLGRAFHAPAGTGWRDAAAVTGLFSALALAAVAVGRLVTGLSLWGGGDPMRALGVDGLMLADPAARTVIWLLVVAAAVLGLRRTAVVLATAGVLVQAGVILLWSAITPVWAMFLLWQFGLAIVVTGLFAVSDRPVRAALGAAVRATGRQVRGRVVVLSAVVLMIGYALQALDLVVTEWRMLGPTAGGVLSAAALLMSPFVVFGGGVLLLGVWERLVGRGHGHVRAHE